MDSHDPQVVILTESGGGRGYGHLSRCTGLQQAFQRSGYEVGIFVHSDQPLAEWIAAVSAFTFCDWKADMDRLLPGNESRSRITVVDSYEADHGLLAIIASQSRICCFFDDNSRIEYPDGVLVNPAADAHSLYKRRMKGIRYLLGPQYAVLRKEFWEKRPYVVRRRVQNALIALGTGVSSQDTLDVAKRLRDTLRTANVTILHESAHDLSPSAVANRIHWLWGLPPEEFIKLALQSDLAVCSGGQILLELACLGVPAISILTAENQRANVAGFEQAGFAVRAGTSIDPACLERLESVVDRYSKVTERAQRSALGRELLDGQGALRVVKALKEETEF